MSKLAQEDELLIKRREHTVKKHVPAPKEPKKSQANDIEYWCRMFMSYIINGRLKYLPRIASTIGLLEPTSSSHQRAKRKEQVNGLSSSNLIFVQNLFNPTTIFDVFKMIGSLRGEFNFDTIFTALEHQDFSKIVEKEHLSTVHKGPFVPFLLMLLYVKLIKSTPEESLRLYSILFKLKQRKIDLPFFKTKLKFDNFINGLVERRIRFYNNYFDDENNIYVHKASLHYNELFETGTLEFINMQKKAEAILKNELYANADETSNPNDVDNQKPAFEKKRDYFLQEDCFTRIREYFGKSEKIVLFNLRFLSERLQELDAAIFSDKNLALINAIMASFLDKQITLQEIPEHCLRLLTKFCLIDHFKKPIVEPAISFATPNLPPLMDDDKLPDVNRILDSIELVKRMMTGIKTSDRIFPLCVVFLGAAIGVLPTLDAKGAYDIIISYLRDQPKEFVTSPYLSSLLNGVGHLMTNITEGQLIETAQLLLNLWTYIEDPIKNPPKIEVPKPPERRPINIPRVPQAAANQQKSQLKRSPTSNSSETAVLQEISSMNAQMGQGGEKSQQQAVDYNRMAQSLNKSKPLPVNPYDNLFNLTVALQLNKIFRHVYRTRMARYESMPLRKRKYRKYLYKNKKKKEKKEAENKLIAENNAVVMNNNANEKVLPPENPNLEMALQHPLVDIEDETDWLIQLMNVCQHSFSKTENPVAKFMCLFAAAGVMKGMLSREESEPAQVINSFDDLVTSGIFELNAYKTKSPEVWRYWRQGLAVLCVLIEKKFPNISDETIIQVILDVLLEDVLDFEQILISSGSTVELVQHVDRRSGSPLFKLSNYFTHAVAELFLQIENPYLCNQIVLRLASFARHIHELWRRYLGNGLAQNKSNTPMGLNGAGKIMKPIFTTIFLSYIVCLKIIEERLNIEQTYLALDFLAYIEFCSFKGLNLQRELLLDLVVFVSNQDPVNFLPRLISYIPLINDKEKFTKDSIAPKDKMTISKFSHFLNIFDILLEQETFVNRYFIENTPVEVIQDELHQDEDDVKQKLAAQHPNQANITEDDNNSVPSGDQQPLNLTLINRPGALNQPNQLRHTILPLLFIFIEHSNKNINRKSHGVFRRIFANPNLSVREEIAPYYLKLSLHHYPELTSVESLAENTTTVVTKFPPTSPLIAHWLKSIAEKIKSIQLTKSATYITIILFQMVTIVNLYFLNFLLRLIEEIIHSSPKKFQLLLCKLLFKIISTNFDYTRKETCIKWYLHLVHDLGLRHEKLDLHGGASGLMWVMKFSSVEDLWLVPQHSEDTIGKIAILFTTLPGYRIVVK